jgi:non-lysosomal glucosylceramidase
VVWRSAAIHDRYAPEKRNPYNEIECSDHYARANASYSVFLAACGFEYDGPAGMIGFAPKIGPEDFRTPFTTADGWGTFTQKQTEGGKWSASLTLKYGKLVLNEIRLPWLTSEFTVKIGDDKATAEARDEVMRFAKPIELREGDPPLRIG